MNEAYVRAIVSTASARKQQRLQNQENIPPNQLSAGGSSGKYDKKIATAMTVASPSAQVPPFSSSLFSPSPSFWFAQRSYFLWVCCVQRQLVAHAIAASLAAADGAAAPAPLPPLSFASEDKEDGLIAPLTPAASMGSAPGAVAGQRRPPPSALTAAAAAVNAPVAGVKAAPAPKTVTVQLL